MAATLERNVVSPAAVSATATPIVYDEWKKVPPGFCTRGMWHGDGLGIKKGEKPKARFDPDGIGDPGRLIGLYARSQTYPLTEPTRSKRMLVHRFVRRNEAFGLRPIDKAHPVRRLTESLWGSVGELVYKSLDYRHCTKGIPVKFRRVKKPTFADALYVLANAHTDWLVIDIDNHRPTRASTRAHLLLVRRLVKNMPEIARSIGAKCVFYDYAAESPQGIHIWICLNRQMPVKSLHETVRRVLGKLSDPALDATLRKNGLKAMGSLEILPTEGQLIRMFGSYDRRVFTTRELRPKNHGFDAESLLDHIWSKTIDGDPCLRYARLAIAGLGNDLHEAPAAISVSPAILALSSTAPTRRSGYFCHIVEACLNGITEEDVLYEAYLSPIAQALYWREFHDRPDRMRLTQDALVRWIDNKHNGLVTRINDGHRREVINQIRHVVKRLPRTPSGIRTYWGKVVANDLVYPNQKVSLEACIDSVVASPVQVTKGSLKRLPALLNGSVGKNLNQYAYNVSCSSPPSSFSLPSSLPALLEERLRSHLRTKKVRTGKSTERIVLFTLNLLNEIGPDGTRTIGEARMNQLAGLGKGRSNSGRYKNLLVSAGILKPGWEKTYSKVKKIAARYHLTPWALDEVRKQSSILAAVTPEPCLAMREAMREKTSDAICASDGVPALPYPGAARPGTTTTILPQIEEWKKSCCDNPGARFHGASPPGARLVLLSTSSEVRLPEGRSVDAGQVTGS